MVEWAPGVMRYQRARGRARTQPRGSDEETAEARVRVDREEQYLEFLTGARIAGFGDRPADQGEELQGLPEIRHAEDLEREAGAAAFRAYVGCPADMVGRIVKETKFGVIQRTRGGFSWGPTTVVATVLALGPGAIPCRKWQTRMRMPKAQASRIAAVYLRPVATAMQSWLIPRSILANVDPDGMAGQAGVLAYLSVMPVSVKLKSEPLPGSKGRLVLTSEQFQRENVLKALFIYDGRGFVSLGGVFFGSMNTTRAIARAPLAAQVLTTVSERVGLGGVVTHMTYRVGNVVVGKSCGGVPSTWANCTNEGDVLPGSEEEEAVQAVKAFAMISETILKQTVLPLGDRGFAIKKGIAQVEAILTCGVALTNLKVASLPDRQEWGLPRIEAPARPPPPAGVTVVHAGAPVYGHDYLSDLSLATFDAWKDDPKPLVTRSDLDPQITDLIE